MDEPDSDYSNFKTPMLTPHNSSRTRTEQYSDAQLSTSQIEYEHMTALQRTFEQNIDLHYSSNNNNQEYESENESDPPEKRATEATDDSNDPSQLQKDQVEKTIDNSLQPPTRQESDYDLHSPVQEATSPEETFSDIISDADCSYEAKSVTLLTDVCRESLCQPCTVKQDRKYETSLLETTFTTVTIGDTEPKKDKNYIGHIMISYNHSTRPLCTRIAKELKNLNYLVWIDQDNISGDILTSMASAIENAYVILMAINEQYYKSRYCRLEAEYGVERNKASIPMLMQLDYKPVGWLGIINGSKLHIDFVQLPFDEAFSLLLREVEAVRNSLGIDGNDPPSSPSIHNNHAITTVSNSWYNNQNVHEWNNHDVIEWLNREKLEEFEEALALFNGATLWQFYKIKFDSPTDYYRYVDSLLPSTTPHRLFYNLTFNGAIEALFASCSPAMQRH